MQVHRLLVLEHERDRVRGEQNERDQPPVEFGLLVLLELFGVDGGAASETHAQILCGYVRGNGAGHEPRLLRASHTAGGVEAEGGAGLLAGEGAKARAAEVAITARCFGSFAHLSLRSGGSDVDYAAILGPILREASVAAHEN